MYTQVIELLTFPSYEVYMVYGSSPFVMFLCTVPSKGRFTNDIENVWSSGGRKE